MSARPLRFLWRAVALTALALAVLPAPAQARLSWRVCEEAPDFQCATLRVPLDRTGALPGTVPLAVSRERRVPRARRVLISLSGGPGQGAVAVAPFVFEGLAPALRRHRLVVLDQRGTGRSGVLRCRKLQRSRLLNPFTATLAAGCAAELGERRGSYATADSVADLEALRRELGVEKVALQGTSYGTYVAQQYARTYPTRVERMVLDSVVGPDGVHPLLLDSWSALPRILREMCAGNACRGITTDPVADVRALAAQLDQAPLRGVVIDGRGRRETVRLGAVGLVSVLLAGDLNSHLRAQLPGAVRAALQGNAASLLRLVEPAIGPPLGLRDLSYGLNAATTCADIRLDYPLTMPIEERGPRIAEAIAAAPEERLGPFSRNLVVRTSADEQCRMWPPGRFVPPSSEPMPDVPTLLLNGRLDIRTPLENAQALDALMPRALMVAVPGNGHDETSTDLSGCVARALNRFFAGRRLGRACARTNNAVPPAPAAPTSLAALAPHRGVPGDRGRVLRAAIGAVNDVRESFFIAADSGFDAEDGGGLRGGVWRARGETGLEYRRVEWAPGVRVTGRLTSRLGRYAGRLRVTAPRGLGGTLRFDRRRGVTGVLGGRRVRLPARAVRGAVEPALVAAFG